MTAPGAEAGTEASLRVLLMLAANPFVTIKGAANKLKVAFTTAQRAVQRLEEPARLTPA